MTARIKIRRDSAASWTSNNPILAAGELGLDTDANQIKVGDGSTAWDTLEYASGGAGFDGTSNLVFQTEDIGFYALGLPQYHWGYSDFRAVAMDSSATGNVAKTIYAVGEYYDEDDSRQKMFVTKRNADDTTAWTVSIVTSNNQDAYPTNITFDAATDKLYMAGRSWDSGNYSFILELDTSNGAILSQQKYTSFDGNYPEFQDLTVDTDGSVVAVGNVYAAPNRQAITPLDAVMANPVQSYSTAGQDLDPDFSLLVFAKTDLTALGFYPDNLSDWRIYDQTNPSDNGIYCNRINEFRNLDTVTLTGTGAGARVNLKYDIGQNKWVYADYNGPNGSPTYTYAVGDTLKVLGSAFGGTDGVDDLILTVRYAYNGGEYGLEFVNINNQVGLPTPPAAVTDYVRLWFYGSYDFAASTNNATVWDIARDEGRSGFILTAGGQLALASEGYWDKIMSGDIYNDGTDSYLYAVGRIEADDIEARGNRCVVYKVKISDLSQVWAWTTDMTPTNTDGDYARSLVCDSQGNVYINSTGYDDVGNFGDIITKLDASGTMQWQVRRDPGTGGWGNDPKLDYDLDNDKLYLGGDSGAGIRIVEINTSTGATTWARALDFTNANYYIDINNSDSQFFAAGAGRIAVAGYSYDNPGDYNGGESFGVLTGFDANLISFSTDEAGISGPFTFSVDGWHTTGGTGSGSARPLNAKFDLQDSTAITAGALTLLTSSGNSINIDPVNITRSPHTIENVKSITFADGSVQSSAGVGVKHKWKNGNGNLWKIVEWNEGASVNYNQYQGTSSEYFNAKVAGNGVDFVVLNIQNTSLQWINFDNINNKPNLRINIDGTVYDWGSSSTDVDGYVTIGINLMPGQTLPSYGVNDTVIAIWDEPQSLQPVVWFDPSNSPYGDNNFRGAIIHYHAFSNDVGANMVGTIHYSYDGGDNEQATHTEHWAGADDGQFMNFWDLDSNGRLRYKNSIYNEDYVFIQWTATMFYGNENYC